MANGWLIAAGVGAAGLGVVLLVRKQAAASTGGGGLPCDKLTAGSPEQIACKAAQGILGIFGALAKLGDPQWAKKDAENKAANGATTIPLASGAQSCNGFVGAYMPLQGTVLRFANGCEPYAGAPGWSKCAPGTHSMIGASGVNTKTRGMHVLGTPARSKPGWGPAAEWEDHVQFEPRFDELLTGRRVEHVAVTEAHGDPNNKGKVYKVSGDPATGVIRPERATADDSFCAKGGPGFPLPIPTGGVAGRYKGEAFVCAAGTIPDLRGNYTGPVRCVAPSELPRTFGGTGGGAGTRSDEQFDYTGAGCKWNRSTGKWDCPPGVSPTSSGTSLGTASTTHTAAQFSAGAGNPFLDVESP
jgi:hypothetical protein